MRLGKISFLMHQIRFILTILNTRLPYMSALFYVDPSSCIDQPIHLSIYHSPKVVFQYNP